MASAATVQIGHRYGYPVNVYGLSTNAHTLEIQSGYERALNSILPALAGADELSGIGEMASGVAHELNQPLTALTSYCGTAATLIKDLPSPHPQLADILERAEEQAHRASLIISHLREFIGAEGGHKDQIDIDNAIRR